MKTGVLVHGCNLNAENWRSVAWGEPPHGVGRIPQGVLIADLYDASVIVFGTGASSKEFRFAEYESNPVKMNEAHYSFEFLRTHFHLLNRFDALSSQMSWLNDETLFDERRDELLGKIIQDTVSMNTAEEIRDAGELFAKQECDRVILVSSPSHIVRCLRDAVAIYHSDSMFSRFRNSIFACPSVTCYEGTSAKDVVVVEPPHRPDRQVIPTHRRIQRMMMLQKLDHSDLVSLIEEFDDLLQKYEDRCN